jgi:hypothetical protein
LTQPLSREADAGHGDRLAEPLQYPSSPSIAKVPTVQTIKCVYWQEDDAWLGYLQDYPDYWTQGETLDDLIDHLKDLVYRDLS